MTKTYLAKVPGPVPRDVIRQIRKGVELDDGFRDTRVWSRFLLHKFRVPSGIYWGRRSHFVIKKLL